MLHCRISQSNEQRVGDILEQYYHLFQNDANLELEAKYSGPITKGNLVALISTLRADGQTADNSFVAERAHEESLDIAFMHEGASHRITINGKNKIHAYCATNKLTPADVDASIIKERVDNVHSVVIPEMNSKIDLRREKYVVPTEKLLDAMKDALKGFRYKHRLSFEYRCRLSPRTSGVAFRYDITLVKTSQGTSFLSHKSFASSKTLTAPEKYEVEIEVLRYDGKLNALLTGDLIRHICFVYAIMNNDASNSKDRNKVMQEYLALWWEKQGDVVSLQEDINKRSRSLFIGPQPVTLELQHVARDNIDTNTILKDYTVTDKADGERCLLFVNSVGACYYITTTLNVHDLHVKLTNKRLFNTILDGEVLTHDKHGANVNIFGVFDIYFTAGKNLRTLPLVDIGGNKQRLCRLNHAKDFVGATQNLFAKHNIDIFVKSFKWGPDVFKEAERHLNMQAIYHTDGLIFTPASLSVGGQAPGEKVPSNRTWNKTFKWKPPSQNTIDFQVKKTTDRTVLSDGNLYNIFNLHVGYDTAKWTPLKPKYCITHDKHAIAKSISDARADDNTYETKLFEPIENEFGSNVHMFCATDDHPKCQNGDVIEDNSIVEFAYTPDNGDHLWTPLRVRKDKTTPNDIVTAMNVWRSILYPVTEDIVTGKVVVNMSDVPSLDDVYYQRSTTRKKFAIKNMNDFHNLGVKMSLIHDVVAKASASSLLDIACGKAGDLNKWLTTQPKIKEVYGIDKARDNIENPKDGAYARVLDKALDSGIDFVFGTLDASQRIDGELLASLKNEDDSFVCKKLLDHEPFDVVSCQFAVHYFCENERTLDIFISNVMKFLKPGGYFIFTCLDGAKVLKELDAHQGNARGYAPENNKLMWSIRRSIGNEIKVFIESIGNEIKEHLVDIDLVTNKLQQQGMILHEAKPFESYFEEVARRTDKAGNAARRMSKDEKRYSFLNTTMVFQRPETVKDVVTPPAAPPSGKRKVIHKTKKQQA